MLAVRGVAWMTVCLVGRFNAHILNSAIDTHIVHIVNNSISVQPHQSLLSRLPQYMAALPT
jgi:hypothetical protein